MLVFFDDLVYKFIKNFEKPNFCDQFEKIIENIRKVGYYMDIMRQSACQMVYSYCFLFNCKREGQASGSMKAPHVRLSSIG